ncbi:MAG: polymerase sigma-70 factor, subfamily [Pseudonocardiales bacterium]|nr:polymerase sigma-70 factor, subfamily [Pseudonocardiales bacterium]
MDATPDGPDPDTLRRAVAGERRRHRRAPVGAALLLRVVVGLSAEETARAVGSKPGTVRAMQHRALASLRAVIGARPLAA